MLAVALALQGGTQPNVTGVTFNGVALTKARGDQGTNGGAAWFNETSIWLLNNPPVGTYTVTVTATVPTNPDMSGASMSYFNCEQTSVADAVNGTTGTTSGVKSTTVTTVENQSMVISVLSYLDDEATNGKVTPFQTKRQAQSMSIGLNGTMLAVDTNTSVPTGANIISYSLNPGAGTTFLYTLTAVSISPNPSNGNVLLNPFTNQNYADVSVDDGGYQITSGSQYLIKEFKKQWTNNTDNINIRWQGRTTVSPRTSPVYVQIYNISTATWETVVSQTVIGADTDFTVTASQTTTVANYYDTRNIVTIRIYQKVV